MAEQTWTKFPLSSRNPLYTCLFRAEHLIIKLASRSEVQRHCAFHTACPDAVVEVKHVFSSKHIAQSEHRRSNRVCMAMPLYPEDVFDVLTDGRDSQDCLEEVFVSGLKALQSFHRGTGYVHADVKGENFVRKADGSLALLDFEFSCKVNSRLSPSATSKFIGTDIFAAPECFASNNSVVGFKADVYSWAVSLLTHVSNINDDWEEPCLDQLARGVEAELHRYIKKAQRRHLISSGFASVLTSCTLTKVQTRFSTEQALAALLN